VNNSVNMEAAMTSERGERQGVPRDAFGHAGCEFRRDATGELLFWGEVPHVDGVHDEKGQPRYRATQIKNSDMDGTCWPQGLVPTLRCPFASSTPPMARFTRFLINGSYRR